MPNPADKDTKEEKKSAPQEAKKTETAVPPKAESTPESTSTANLSEISPRALPDVEPHVYKPETPASATPQTTPETKETPAQSSPPEQKPSPLEEDSMVAGEPLFEPEVKSRKKLYIIVSIILVLVIAVSAWFFMNFNKNKNTEEKKPETTKSQQISAPVVIEEESEVSFDRSKFSVEVLNGSGIAGAARKVADNLAALKYQVVKVGNAQENSQTSQILISKDLEKFQDEFLKDLEGIIQEATISGKLEDSTASARITIGID